MTAERVDITIEQGVTFDKTFNWYGGGKVTREIEGVIVGCPTRVTVTAHGLPAGATTPVYISHVKGARSLNADEVLATYVDDDTFDVDVHTRDETYTTGTGCLVYYAPTDLTGYIARMDIRESIDDDTTLVSLTSAGGDITLTAATGAVNPVISSTVTAALDFYDGVYDLEVEDTSGVVTRLVSGDVTFSKEVTRT